METILSRYRNVTILVAVLFAQVLTLAVQVKRPSDRGPVRLLRVWTVAAITPVEKGVVYSSGFFGRLWHDYFWLRGVRQENAELRQQMEQMRLEQIRLAEDAAQARRLQALLAFKEQFIAQTVGAQVIGSGGSELSRTVYIDKDASDGLRPDMAVIAPEGVVGKIIKVFPGSSQVLLITDPASGVGAILSKSRLQGILKGTAAGEIVLQYVMADEKVEPGDLVLTSGGDRVFPKGLPIGTVTQVRPGADLFLNIRVRPAAPMARLEEVLVITRMEARPVEAGEVASGPRRAADILAERLPTLAPAGAAAGTSSGIPLSTAEQAARERAAKTAAGKGMATAPAAAAPGTAAPTANRTGVPPTTAEFLRQQKAAQPGSKPPTAASPKTATPKPPPKAESPKPAETQPPPGGA